MPLFQPFYTAVASVRARLPGSSIKRKARKLDPILRDAMATDIDAQLIEAGSLEELQHDLQSARQALQAAVEKEIFLGQRSRHYRKILDEQAARLREEQRNMIARQQESDLEADAALQQEADDLERRLDKWEADEDALQSIIASHRDILVEIERLRRRIDELEQQRRKLLGLREECQAFVEAAADAKGTVETELRCLTAGADEVATETEETTPNQQEQAV